MNTSTCIKLLESADAARVWGRLGVAAAGFAVWTTALNAATLTVGPGQQFGTVAAAVNASHDGDTIDVMAGLYVNDFAEIRTRIVLQAVGGMAQLQATENIPNEKAILITDTDITISGFELLGAKVTNGQGANGAGIRYQGGAMVLNNCYIHNNQEGILAASASTGTITINSSEFARNGDKTGPGAGYTHNIYVNDIAQLDIENSYIHDANVGHELKSRAAVTIVRNTRVVDGPTSTASYSIDLPNGGTGMISNDRIEQGPNSQNPIIVAFGEEGVLYPASGLTVQNSLIENDLNSGYALAVWNTSPNIAAISNNTVFGLVPSQMATGPANIAGTNYATAETVISTAHPWKP